MNRSQVRFEYEKSPVHIIVYGGTGTGKIYFLVNTQSYTYRSAKPLHRSKPKPKPTPRSRKQFHRSS